MSDIKLWLESLGLGKYADILVSHDIDLTVAPDLTEQDLEKLGLSLGHRRKFIAAATKLRAMPAPAAGAPAPVRRASRPWSVTRPTWRRGTGGTTRPRSGPRS